jgi:hypothetical protein
MRPIRVNTTGCVLCGNESGSNQPTHVCYFCGIDSHAINDKTLSLASSQTVDEQIAKLNLPDVCVRQRREHTAFFDRELPWLELSESMQAVTHHTPATL